LKVMRWIYDLLELTGQVLFTILVGRDVVHILWHRVYGRERLPKLLEGFEVVRSRFLQKQPGGAWFVATQQQALDTPGDIRRYALGEMILKPTV